MFVSSIPIMNLRLNNELRGSHRTLARSRHVSAVKEERRRTGRYIAILVGISLFLLAMYHAWVRRIPIVASLVVPALIMFVYVAWVLYSASKDKQKLLDAEAALHAAAAAQAMDNDSQYSEQTQNNMDVSIVSSKDSTKANSPEGSIYKGTFGYPINKEDRMNNADVPPKFVAPIILINDKLPEDLDQKWTVLVQTFLNSEKFKSFPTRRKYKRKFCRRKLAVFKRSYSIA